MDSEYDLGAETEMLPKPGGGESNGKHCHTHQAKLQTIQSKTSIGLEMVLQRSATCMAQSRGHHTIRIWRPPNSLSLLWNFNWLIDSPLGTNLAKMITTGIDLTAHTYIRSITCPTSSVLLF